jgi:ribonuclease HI
MVIYAVARGHQVGLFSTWDSCNSATKGYSGAIFKKFQTEEEAKAFLQEPVHSVKAVQKEPVISIRDEFIPDYYVYTDGSCSNNGKPNAAAGIGIYFGEDDIRNVSLRIDGKQSNNTAELTAIIHTYELIGPDIDAGKKVMIVSDSEYAIRCATTYGEKCAKENWTKDMPNKELVQKLHELYTNTPNVRFIHIMAHTGKGDIHSKGNDGADRLANQAIGLEQCPYSKIYLNVPYTKKEDAKKLGASWDPSKKQWFLYDNSQHKDTLLAQFKNTMW